MIASAIFDHQARLHSYEIVAELMSDFARAKAPA
jgi:hypothetical protein